MLTNSESCVTGTLPVFIEADTIYLTIKQLLSD